VIVRISTEGQYEVTDTNRMQELDNAAVAAVENGDEAGFHAAYDELLAFVRGGTPVGHDELFGSDLILPPPDVSLAEAREEFSGEGLLPG
jgi:hypothetical protein